MGLQVHSHPLRCLWRDDVLVALPFQHLDSTHLQEPNSCPLDAPRAWRRLRSSLRCIRRFAHHLPLPQVYFLDPEDRRAVLCGHLLYRLREAQCFLEVGERLETYFHRQRVVRAQYRLLLREPRHHHLLVYFALDRPRLEELPVGRAKLEGRTQPNHSSQQNSWIRSRLLPVLNNSCMHLYCEASH